MIDYWWRK